MLTIKKVEAPEEIAAYCRKNALSRASGMEQYMGVYADGALIGLGSLQWEHMRVYLDFIHAADSDPALVYGLAKALLNMADLKGIQTVYGRNAALTELYTALRFKKNNNEFLLSLDGYFTENNCK